MNITLKTFATIRDVVGAATLSIELPTGARLSDLFAHLTHTYGKNFDRQVRDQLTGAYVPFLILVNTTPYRSTHDIETPLHDGDVVTIMVPFDGG
ncbi:MAG: MoaD family protein [Desulfobacterota bacterium]|nr:MoaD family protein [Thermodesulfobacteriota bacterium]